MRVLLDTNVLLRLDDPDSSDHPVCAAALDRLLAGDSQLCICAQVMIAYGITQLLTLNPSDFARYPEITPVTPADVLSRTA